MNEDKTAAAEKVSRVNIDGLNFKFMIAIKIVGLRWLPLLFDEERAEALVTSSRQSLAGQRLINTARMGSTSRMSSCLMGGLHVARKRS
jgi:hypothetical protein